MALSLSIVSVSLSAETISKESSSNENFHASAYVWSSQWMPKKADILYTILLHTLLAQ